MRNILSKHIQFEHKKIVAAVLLTSLLMPQFSVAQNACSELVQIEKKAQANKDLVGEFDLKSLTKLSASWEITRQGVGRILSDLHEMDTTVWYQLIALMTKENVMISGAGGGAKTLGAQKVMEAQINAVKGLNAEERAKFDKDLPAFKLELLRILAEDKKIDDPAKRIFTLQMHATLSETAVLGGPNPIKVVEDGDYAIDYSKALISEQNKYAILDEIEKAPVALQMTLLSIMNERQALVGNKVIKTLLESIVMTTNATTTELVTQASPHEIGGRLAFIDRATLKVTVVNVSKDADDLFLLLEVGTNAKAQQATDPKYVIIDARGLSPLLKKVKIPAEMLDAMSEVTLHMDRFYTDKVIRAQEEVKGTTNPPGYFAPFSGSTRSQSKAVKIWKAAFLSRQLMQGVPFESMKTVLQPKDLIDIAPVVLEGGPDQFIPKYGYNVRFMQNTDAPLANNYLRTHIKNARSGTEGNKNIEQRRVDRGIFLSTGHYDPNTKLFQFQIHGSPKIHVLKFDVASGKLISEDQTVLRKLRNDPQDWSLSQLGTHPVSLKYLNIEETLAKIEAGKLKSARHNIALEYTTTNRAGDITSKSPARDATKANLAVISEAQNSFLGIVNTMIQQLQAKKMTYLDPAKFEEKEKFFDQRAEQMTNYVRGALKKNVKEEIENASILSIQNAYHELTYRFLDNDQVIRSIFLAILNRKNVMIAGGPGSGKTLLSRIIMEKMVEWIGEAQIAQANSILASHLLENKIGEDAIWIKQFHPMSSEGEVLGRLDLKAIRSGKGYTYNRTGSMAAKTVLMVLLDEFEKAPAGVKTALLSLLNERKVMGGDEVIKSNILSVLIATNSTPGEFLMSLGNMSTAFPVFDRIQVKALSGNKLPTESLKEFHRRNYMGVDVTLKNPLLINPAANLIEGYKVESDEKRLLAKIHQDFMVEAVRRSEGERAIMAQDAPHEAYMNSRGESNRSAMSTINEEFPGAVLLHKILEGETPEQIRGSMTSFDPKDLVAFGELYTTYNDVYKIVYEYDAQGMIVFKVKEKDMATLNDRIDGRTRKNQEDNKFEFDLIVQLLNKHFRIFYEEKKRVIAENPGLYPSLFASQAVREKWKKNYNQ